MYISSDSNIWFEFNSPDRLDHPFRLGYELYISRATTCKKALKWLEDNGIRHETIDIKVEHPDEETLRKYCAMSGLPLKRFFNTSGIPYREMGLSKKLPSMSDDEQLALLATDGMLVKRPLAVADGFVLTGFKEEEWKEKSL